MDRSPPRALAALALAALLAACSCPRRDPCAPCGPATTVSARATAQVVLAPAPQADADLDRLVECMSGEFSSAAQAKEDGDYRDIHLAMARIWRGRDDGRWLYVEQAVATMLDRPYRQRVYQIVRTDADTIESRVFQLKDPKAAVGAWKGANPLAALTPADLEPLAGCAVVLRRAGADAFEGGTRGKECRNSFGGATYATSEVRVTATGIDSWDRGYDAADKQTWGAEKGGYRFLRTAPKATPDQGRAP
jgi:hypothetical protein